MTKKKVRKVWRRTERFARLIVRHGIWNFYICRHPYFKANPLDQVKPLFCIRLKFAQEILSESYYLVTSGFTGASYKLNFGETLVHRNTRVDRLKRICTRILIPPT